MHEQSTSNKKFLYFYAVLLTLILIRLWPFIFWPEMLYEDATHMLSFFFNTHDFVYVLRQLNGYTSLLPNIVAWLSLQASLVYSPYLMTCTALFIFSCSLFVFCLPNFRYLIKNDQYRFAICILLCLLPFSKAAIVANITNSQWSFLVLFPLLLIAEPPKKILPLSLYLIFSTAIALSHPLNIATFPLLFILIWVHAEPRKRIIYIYFLIVIFLYFKSASSAAQNTSKYLNVIGEGAFMFFQRVPFELLIGAKARQYLYNNGFSYFVSSMGLLISCVPLFICWKRKLPLNTILIILGFLGTAFAFTLISQTRMTFEYGLTTESLQRFFHAPRVLIVLAFATALLHNKTIKINRGPLYIGLTITVIYLSALNYYNTFLYTNYSSVSDAVFSTLNRTQEELNKANNEQPYQSTITGGAIKDWPLYLDIDCHLKRKNDCFDAEIKRLSFVGNLEMPKSFRNKDQQ